MLHIQSSITGGHFHERHLARPMSLEASIGLVTVLQSPTSVMPHGKVARVNV